MKNVKPAWVRLVPSATAVFAVAAIVLCGSLPAGAATPLSQGYKTRKPLAIGSIVGIESRQSDVVTPATSSTVNNIFGIVINGDNSVLSLSDGSTSQAQIATSGILPVLVSDINGPIVQGDQVTASPIEGVGMKATNNTKVIGIAQSKSTGDMKQTYKDKDGTEHSVTLGQADVLVNVAYYYKQPDKTIIPGALQNIANALAGKTVSSLPIIISSIIFLITLVIVSSIIYSMIRSSIISVGRNPMSQSAVYRDVIQLSVLVLGILAVAIISIYIVLTRF